MLYDISIVIVNYNGKKYLRNLFDSFIQMECGPLNYEIVFVDNNSSDDSISYLQENYSNQLPNLKIVCPEANLGFAGGNNYGVKHASGEFIIFLNNDTRVENNWLLNIHSFMLEHKAGIVSSKLVFFYDYLKFEVKTTDKVKLSSKIQINDQEYTLDPKFCKNLLYDNEILTCFGHTYFYVPLLFGTAADYRICFKTIEKYDDNDRIVITDRSYDTETTIEINKEDLEHYKLTLIQNVGSGIDAMYNGYDIGFCEEDHGQYDTSSVVNSVCGAAMMIRREDFIKLGMFDENFFMYYEDTDLSYRAQKMGKPLLYCPTAVVRHIHTGSSKEWSPFFIYYVYRNRLLFILKNISLGVFTKQLIKLAIDVLRTQLSQNQNKDIKKAKWGALLSVLRHIPQYIQQK